MTLTREKCVACRRDSPKVTPDEIAELHPIVSDWKLTETDGIKRLERTFRVRDFAEVRASGKITAEVAAAALALLEVDALGLDELDHRLLRTIAEKFDGGPVGLETLAASISEESDTIMDVYEPYLMQLGFLSRTPRGRVATRLAYEHLGIAYPAKLARQQASLFDGHRA